ncbi:MAG: hypothetical protein NTU58_01490 [Candidatus Nealsonbacteria bacterium]|nr:hypothetical protein [Candidatus Nealsonbacteria bacterium]
METIIVNTKTTICKNKTNFETVSVNDLLENMSILIRYIIAQKSKKIKKNKPKLIINMDYKKYYDLENYLFGEVKNNFKKHGYLTPEEFFCIVIWKANRAKSKIKDKIFKKGENLNKSIKKLTSQIFKASSNKEKLRILLEDWEFGLPMASALLTVLYPKNFTIYDVRVRNQFGIKDFSGRKNQIEKYFSEFLPKVKKQSGKNLREKDKYLWGKSFFEDLRKFLK